MTTAATDNAPAGHDAGEAAPRALDPVDAPSHAVQARSLVDGHGLGALSTLQPDGQPFGSYVQYVLDDAGRPTFFLSELAEHTRNLRGDGRASLLVTPVVSPTDDPMAMPRVTLVGTLDAVDEAEVPALVERFLAAHPTAESYVSFGDFAWWRLSSTRVRFVGGYGRMSWVDEVEYETAAVDPLASVADRIIAHMNDDHADAALAYVQVLAGLSEATSARLIAVDRLGMELVATTPAGIQPARVNFDEPAESTDAVRSAVIALLQRTRPS